MKSLAERWPDLVILLAYMAAMVAIGVRFSRKQTNTETYFVAKRSVPSWAMGFSLVATLITSVTFVAYPGSAYAKNWSLLVPGLMVVGVLALVGAVIIPFYREAVGMSAYEYFGQRFGRGARMYASFAFCLAHFSKMGFIFYLLALTIRSLTGWDLNVIVLGVGVATIFYTLIGGLEAVIWSDVLQGFVLWVGVIICLGYLFFLPPGGPSAVLSVAWEHGKFSLGSTDFNLRDSTLIVLIFYGFFWYLQRYTADQTVVQRYLVAKTDRAAIKGVAMGAGLCVPVWALFMLIGTCTWSFYKLTGEKLPAHITKADQVFPFFLATHLPVGMAGLFMASLVGAAMSGLASDLNALAVVGVEDFYRAIRKNSTDRERLKMAKVIVAVCGILCVAVAIGLARTSGSALSLWFTVSAIASGGLAGLFLLAFLCTRAHRRGAQVGIVVSVLVILWAAATTGARPFVNLGRFNYTWNDQLIGMVGHVALFVSGYLASRLIPAREPTQGHTLRTWLKSRKPAS